MIWLLPSLRNEFVWIAVLAPFGPLRILVETAQERNEQIYSSGIVYALGRDIDNDG